MVIKVDDFNSVRKIKSIFIFIIVFIIFHNISFAQKFDWLESVGSTENTDVYDMVVHNQFIYIAGEFSDNLSFDNLTFYGRNWTDIFVAKYDTLGNLYWVQPYMGMSESQISSITTDNHGNVYIAGRYEYNMIFGSDTLPRVDFGDEHSFVVSIDPSGQIRWARHFNSKVSTFPQLASDEEYIYLAGNYTDSLFFDYNFLFKGDIDCFLLKMDTNANLQWYKSFGKQSGFALYNRSTVSDMDVSSDSNIYLTGYYSDTLKYDTIEIHTSSNGSNTFVLKVNPRGDAKWLKSSIGGGNYNVTEPSLIVDNMENVYIGGYFRNTMGFDTTTVHRFYPGGAYIFKLSSQGNSIYGKSYYADDQSYINDLSIGEKNSLYATGTFEEILYFGNDSIISHGASDILIMKHDSTGSLEWVQYAGGNSGAPISPIKEEGVCIASDLNGNAYLSGQFIGMAVFGTTQANTISTNPDIFLTRLSECGNYTAEIQAIGDSIWCGNLSSPVQLMTPTTGTGYLFQWYKGNIPLAGETYRNLFPQDTGTYSVIVNNNGCIDTSRTITISADSLPSVSLAPFATVCANDTAFALSGGSPIGGTWSGNGVVNGYFDPSLADTGWAKISYVYSNGTCSDTASQNIYVSPVPNASITGPLSVCAFSTGNTYTANSSQNLSYQWNISGGSITNGQGTSSISVNWGAAGTGTVTLTAFRFNSVSACDTIIVQDTVEIDNPQFNASIQGADSVCANTNYTYSVPSNGILYQWQVTGGQIISGLNTSSINVKWNTAGQGTIYLKMFNSCFNDTILRDTVVIIPGASPTITGNTSVCSGSTGIAYSSGTINSTYQWSITGGTLASGQGTSSITVDWGNTVSGNVSLTETVSNGCSGTTNLQIAINSVDPSFSQSSDTLFASASSASYQWLECKLSTGSYSAIPGETSNFMIANKSGSYALEVTKNGCTDTSACMQIIVTGIKNQSTAFDHLIIYPNPSDGVFIVEIKSKTQENLQIELLDMSGKTLFQKELPPSNTINEKLDFSQLAKGIYFLKLNSGTKQKVKKLVIQ